ncbi:MAG: PocR ligand-binding domain-containing protein [Chthoniobacteraceae bacterium]|nr:PocR ligand-binding domain-containing protein [Chthoniobacteraceae bacterium]
MYPDLEFVFRPETQAIFDQFCALLGIRIAFYSPSGEELRVGQGRAMCAYCGLLRRELGLEGRCRALDAASREKAARSGSLTEYSCHGGMVEAMMPVCVSGRLLGFAMIGQFRQREKPPARLLAQADAKLRQRLERAYLRVPRFDPSKKRLAVGLFETLIRHIAESRLIDRRDRIAAILDRLRDKPGRRLPLRQAAALAGCSASQFSRLFRKAAGQSYERTRIALLLERADALLRVKPPLRIQEIAFQLGFEDPLYFSRIYRKHRGVSPKRAGRE